MIALGNEVFASQEPHSLLLEVLAEHALLADPSIVARASALSELDCARLERSLRDAKVRSRDVDAFRSKVAKARKDRVREGSHEKHAPREHTWRDDLIPGDAGRPAACFSNLCLFLEHLYDGRLSYDTMAERPCLDGQPVDDRMISAIRRRLGASEGANFGKEDIAEGLSLVGSEFRSFHPVKDYLLSCRRGWDGEKRLDSAATTLLKVPERDSLARIMFRRALISMVARGLEPGEKVDTILILLGYQGQKKSTLFRALGGSWFGDSKVDINDRKGQMVMACKWIYEWPEVDRVFQKHSDSDIKAFVSQENDDFIPMYGRSVRCLLRSWVAVGTTNRRRFLTDVTGDRRVWVIDLHRNGRRWKVSEKLVSQLRDQLFGEAVAEYQAYIELKSKGVPGDENPHRWWLNDEEEAAREERTSEYRVENAWGETVERWLAGEPVKCGACRGTGEITSTRDGDPLPCGACRGNGQVKRTEPLPVDAHGRTYVTPAMVMTQALGIPPERHQQHGLRISDTLSEVGWRQGTRCRISGVRVTPYYSPAPNAEADANEAEARHQEEERAAIAGA